MHRQAREHFSWLAVQSSVFFLTQPSTNLRKFTQFLRSFYASLRSFYATFTRAYAAFTRAYANLRKTAETVYDFDNTLKDLLEGLRFLAHVAAEGGIFIGVLEDLVELQF